jgi:Co/Zn/Cd efflux system component
MTMKSILGYALAFCIAIIIWQLVTRKLDKRFIETPPSETDRMNTSVLVGVAIAVSGLFLFYLGLDLQGILISLTAGIGSALILSRFNQNTAWTALQWASTGFLWGQWLIQDFANIYVYLPRALSGTEIFVSMFILLSLLGYIFYSKGGAIQKIVKSKTNTADIRSATMVDFVYGIVLLFFKEFSNVPMSTTWVFLGLLAGREIAIRYRLELIKEPSDIEKAPIYHYLGQALNVIIILLIGYVVYLRDQVPDLIIIVMALVMIIRAFIVYKETIPGQLNLKSAFRDIGWDLSKVTLGLVISIVLVKVMQFLTGVGM